MKKVFIPIFVLFLFMLFLPSVGIAEVSPLEKTEAGNIKMNILLTEEEERILSDISPLTVMADDSFTPLSYYDQIEGKYYGAIVELFESVADSIGLKYDLVYNGSISWSDKLNLIKEKKIDILFPVSITETREEFGFFSEPYYHMYYSVISRTDNNVKINNFYDIENKKIGLVKGTSISDFVEKRISDDQITYYSSDKKMYQGLKNKDIDFSFQNENVFVEDFYKYELFYLNKIYRIVESPKEYCYFFRQGEDMTVLLGIFNRALNTFDASELIEKYEDGELAFVGRYMKQKRDKEVMVMILAFMTAFLSVLMLVFLRNKDISEKLKQEAALNEMAYLQSQIRPHFLFNALSAIIAFCYTDPEKAGSLLNSLSKYLRIIFKTGNRNELITFSEEIDLVQSYIDIEQARYGERLKTIFNISDECLKYKIMPLVIQPLVENAIRHNINEKEEGIILKLNVLKIADDIQIIIEDNGIGISKENITKILNQKETNFGIGLANIYKRIKHYKGKRMVIESKEGNGTRITLLLPAIKDINIGMVNNYVEGNISG